VRNSAAQIEALSIAGTPCNLDIAGRNDGHLARLAAFPPCEQLLGLRGTTASAGWD